MFGGNKKKRAALKEAIVRWTPALGSTDITELNRARDAVHGAWLEASDVPLSDEAQELARKLAERIDEVGLAKLRLTLRSCPGCEAIEYRISDPLAIDHLDAPTRMLKSPGMRLVVCVGCGATQFFLANVHQLTTGIYADYFKLSVRVDGTGGGPFR